MTLNNQKIIFEMLQSATKAESLQDYYQFIFNEFMDASCADGGFFAENEDDFLSFKIVRGINPRVWKKPPIKSSFGIFGRTANSGKSFFLENLESKEEIDFILGKNYQSGVIIPFIFRGKLLAFLALFSHEKDYFNEKISEQLDRVSEAASIFLNSFENSVNAKRVLIHKKNSEILAESIKTLSDSFGFSESLYAVLAIAAKLTNAQSAIFLKFDKEQYSLFFQNPSYGKFNKNKLKIEEDERVVGRAFFSGKTQILGNVEESNLKKLYPEANSILAVPLKSFGRSLGVIVLFSGKTNNFSHEDEKSLEKIASVAGASFVHFRAAETAEGEKNKKESIFSALDEGIIEIDHNQKVVFANKPAQNLLKSADEPKGRNLKDLIRLKGEISEEKFFLQLKDVLSGKSASSTFNTSDIQIILTPVKNGENLGAIIFFKDLKNKNAPKDIQDTLLAVAAHELRTPIVGIRSYLELILSGSTGNINHETREILEEANVVTNRLLRQIESILYVSRIEEGNVSINKEKFNLTKTISEVISEFESRAKEKNLKISFKDLSPAFVRADKEKTKEILANLIDNALKYSFRGEVKVALTKIGNFIEAAVIDEGIGMTKESIKKLFSKFYRIITPQTKNIEGTGLVYGLRKI